MRMKRNLILLSVFFYMVLSLITLTLSAQNQMTTEEYVNEYANWAVQEMQRTGIPASITLGQGILESGAGNSRLAQEANNHFGIKCHSDWSGEKIFHDDDASQECFRKYKSAFDSFKDHSEFLLQHTRYAFLFQFPADDYKAWAEGLKKAGYATNPKYAELLIGVIEKYELFKYDQDNLPNNILAETGNRSDITPGFSDNWVINPYQREILSNNGRHLIIARGGDNVNSLSQEFDLMAWQIFQYNDMKKGVDTISAGQIVYLQPKRNRADLGYDTHIVKEGESLWSISQDYGIKLNRLAKLNKLEKNTTVNVGDSLFLRKNPNAFFLGLF
jgi:hypothetical protein